MALGLGHAAWDAAHVTELETLGGHVNADQYMRQLIRIDATEQQDRRLRDGFAARESGRSDMPDGDVR